MKIELGDMKVVITAGLTSDNKGCIKFEKSFEAYDIHREHIYDVPMIIYFKDKASVDTVIKQLKHIKEVMPDEE